MEDPTLQRLLALEPTLQHPRALRSPELWEVYDVYNLITGENRKPNGCSACLNAVITRLKKELRNLGRV